MGTNAVIRVDNSEVGVELYKHYDGYPDATLPWLEKFASEFIRERGCDPTYMMAQLVRSSVSMADEFNLDNSTATGWGIGCTDSFGYDYLYLIDPMTGEVTVK